MWVVQFFFIVVTRSADSKSDNKIQKKKIRPRFWVVQIKSCGDQIGRLQKKKKAVYKIMAPVVTKKSYCGDQIGRLQK